jgi:hypothetical protein
MSVRRNICVRTDKWVWARNLNLELLTLQPVPTVHDQEHIPCMTRVFAACVMCSTCDICHNVTPKKLKKMCRIRLILVCATTSKSDIKAFGGLDGYEYTLHT